MQFYSLTGKMADFITGEVKNIEKDGLDLRCAEAKSMIMHQLWQESTEVSSLRYEK